MDTEARAKEIVDQFHEEVETLSERGHAVLVSRVAYALAQAVTESRTYEIERTRELLDARARLASKNV